MFTKILRYGYSFSLFLKENFSTSAFQYQRRLDMQKFIVWMLCASVLLYSSGCSISAMNQKPGPIAIESLKEHPHRGELISVFGSPVTSDTNQEGVQTDYWSFIDGYHGATKLRALVYVAGCVFTLCLSELLFWPLEANTMIGMEGTAIATYDDNHVAQKVEIYDEEGQPWDKNWRTPPTNSLASANNTGTDEF